MIRNYIVGQAETLTLIPIGQASGGHDFILADEVLTNGFSDLILYTDAAGAAPVPLADYDMTTVDATWTSDEAQVGGTGKTVYSQYQVTNATYQGIDLWATFTNFGTYTDNDAAYNAIGGSATINSTVTLSIPEGYTRYRFNFDSSLGDIAPVMPNGSFDGQQVILKDTGEANMTRIKGPGFYLGADSGGMYLKSRSILVTWNEDDSVWEMDDCVTADYAIGSEMIEQSSYGRMEITNVTTVALSTLYTFAVPFSSVPRIQITPSIPASTVRIVGYSSITSAGATLQSMDSSGSASSSSCSIKVNGKF